MDFNAFKLKNYVRFRLPIVVTPLLIPICFLANDGFGAGISKYSGHRVKISEGKFTPQFGAEKNRSTIAVSSFWLDSHPATQADFKAFLIKNDLWLDASRIEFLVDEKYKKTWLNHQTFSINTKYYPATDVSWFAAEAYCEFHKGRLPTVFEWEYVANASESNFDASKDPEFINKILNWYGKTTARSPLFSVFQGKPNAFGVYHMHGLIWEWTYDFNSTFMSADSRQNGEKDNNYVCGISSLSAEDRENYAAFMRYSLRSSLKANDSLSNLGFRCAYDSAS